MTKIQPLFLPPGGGVGQGQVIFKFCVKNVIANVNNSSTTCAKEKVNTDYKLLS
jgi:hypothetical protein